MIRFSDIARRAAEAALVLFAAIALHAAGAQETGTGTGTDAADYFFKKQSLSVEQHPWLTSYRESTHGTDSPMIIWSGEDDSNLTATFKAQGAYFAQGNSWFGKSEENLGKSSNDWWETALTPGIQGSYFMPERGGEIYGRVSAVFATTDGIDAAGSNVPYGSDVTDVRIEDAYAGWRSGDLFASLGKDALDISFGRQQYIAGTGFLFYSESSNGKNRGGYWLGERHVADYAGIVRLKTGDWKSDLLYLKADDNPDSNTKAGGITIDYTITDELGGVGGGYYRIASDIDTRDSMNVYDIRFSLTPFKAFDVAQVMKPFTFDGEYVYEKNDDKLEASGWYLSGGYALDTVAWKPTLTYRYASFEGNDPDSSKSQDFDPLFYGFYDWGYWFQGEILGEYVLSNSNLNSHMLRLNVEPTEDLAVNLFYYIFKLDNAEGFGVQSDDFATEWNLTVDWTVNRHLSFSLVGAYANPDDGAQQYTGGDENWSYGMVYVNLSF